MIAGSFIKHKWYSQGVGLHIHWYITATQLVVGFSDLEKIAFVTDDKVGNTIDHRQVYVLSNKLLNQTAVSLQLLILPSSAGRKVC